MAAPTPTGIFSGSGDALIELWSNLAAWLTWTGKATAAEARAETIWFAARGTPNRDELPPEVYAIVGYPKRAVIRRGGWLTGALDLLVEANVNPLYQHPTKQHEAAIDFHNNLGACIQELMVNSAGDGTGVLFIQDGGITLQYSQRMFPTETADRDYFQALFEVQVGVT